MRLTDIEKAQLLDKLLKYASEGNEEFMKVRGRKGAYFDWMFYDGCQACKAAETIADDFGVKKLRTLLKKKN